MATTWKVSEARTRVPIDLESTHTGRCSPAKWRICPICAWLKQDMYNDEGYKASHRESNNASKQRTYEDSAHPEIVAAYWLIKYASTDGKRACQECDEFFDYTGFGRDSTADMRQRRCFACALGHSWNRLIPLWVSRGFNPDQCAYCRRPIRAGFRNIEHFIPRKLGGTSDPWNLVPACPNCNHMDGIRAKMFREPFEWLQAEHPTRVHFFSRRFLHDGTPITPEMMAESLAGVGGAFVYLAAVYLHQNKAPVAFPTKSMAKE